MLLWLTSGVIQRRTRSTVRIASQPYEEQHQEDEDGADVYDDDDDDAQELG